MSFLALSMGSAALHQKRKAKTDYAFEGAVQLITEKLK